MEIQIEEGLILNSPTKEINTINYIQKTNKIVVEMYFREGSSSFVHSRSYTFDNPSGKDLLRAEVMLMINNHELLKSIPYE